MGHESTELAHHCARTKVCTRDLGKFRPLAAQELGRAPPAKITQNRPSSESQVNYGAMLGSHGSPLGSRRRTDASMIHTIVGNAPISSTCSQSVAVTLDSASR